jgi:hypothetical protein
MFRRDNAYGHPVGACPGIVCGYAKSLRIAIDLLYDSGSEAGMTYIVKQLIFGRPFKNYVCFNFFFTFGCIKFQKINVMKRLLLLLMVSGIAVSHAQTVREENRGMIGKITATWCGPCGSWGWTMSDEFISKYEDDAFYVGIFASSRTDGGNNKFRDSTAYAWASMFGMSGFPSFSVNGVDKSLQNTSGNSVNTAGITQDVTSAMEAYISSPVIAGTGYWYRKDGSEITVQIKTKFFEDVTGNYYVAAYLVEDGAMNVQASKAGTVAHHNVLRGSMSRNGDRMNHWGEQIVSGSASAGDEFETSITLDVATQTLSQSQGWDMAKLKVITIIWKKNSMGKYEYVNSLLLYRISKKE